MGVVTLQRSSTLQVNSRMNSPHYPNMFIHLVNRSCAGQASSGGVHSETAASTRREGIHFRQASWMSLLISALTPLTRVSLLLASTRKAHQIINSKGVTAMPRTDINTPQVGAKGNRDHLSNGGVMGCKLRRTKSK
jgi:hypothetical protein